ncbi:MAG: L,D-transpeptidase family protein, partial [Bacteroidales bacterium]|nr:L,D-transpeptidase family protein [Bacteroidales bacterium]
LKPVAPQITDISESLAKAQHLLNTPISVRGYDPIYDEKFEWAIPRDVIGSWLTISPGDQGPIINVDENQVGAYLATLDEALGPERWIDPAESNPIIAQAMRSETPAVLSIRHKSTSYIVKSGDTLLKIGWNLGFPIWVILNANPGMDPDNLLAGQVLTIPSRDELLPLPVVENKRIVLSISKQRMWVYENGELLGKHVISTGMDRSPTQPGVFQVQTHDPKAYASVWDLTMPNFLGIYEAWPGFMNGIHGLPTLSNGRRLWANILGRPASYGCIILDLKTAKWLYNWAEDGVVVEIEP